MWEIMASRTSACCAGSRRLVYRPASTLPMMAVSAATSADGKREPGASVALARARDHRLGVVEAQRVPSGQPLGERPGRQPGTACDVTAVPVGLGGQKI